MDRGSVKRYRNKPRKSLIEVACFFLIGNLRTIINEKKRKVQVVHDDEQEETEETNNKTKEKEIRKIN